MEKRKVPIANHEGPYERLVGTAIRLIYSQGYAGTSVNQVIGESDSHKASFYRYFQTKEDLGREYLKIQATNFRNSWERLMARSATPVEFINRWMALLNKQVREKKYFGCPLARFMGSLDQPDQAWVNQGAEVLESWIHCLETYFEENITRGLLPRTFPARKKAERLMKLFQANSQFYMITGNSKFFKELQEEMIGELT
ncbi:transcriptional regulator, TetR family [Leptospira inadai serovar Lyme str. 10]|uniref:Transcriptional regulator, TetR family n=2 Tax=Leptospira inadai serovar Lyme TaxID=293084 RepID=V6HV15_9LEPT|nr:TetR/AcrR family transcriptional regulator [Leptospira inadai]EQA36654.1 transcriptional regulator, TetR family [Leptospira inadai serovar Lyme str. 10]PNV74562.1 TetR/AcrR family transcriptional regulator [Leptospira inadai serovar Lyme]